jgi:arsenate reductase
MAEAILRHYAGNRFEAASCGLEPKPIDPMTLAVLEEVGLDTTPLRSKGVEEFLGKKSVAHAIVVCDVAQAACPKLFPFALEQDYWPFEDPVRFVGTDEARLAMFRQIRQEIDEKIRSWLQDSGV